MCLKVSLKLFDINRQIVCGLWKIGRIAQPCVSIFGGSRHVIPGSYYYEKAAQAAKMLVEGDISVITGGGPGIMEAANCGAHTAGHDGDRTIKVIISGLSNGQKPNHCPGKSVIASDFFARKWLLIDYSIGFIVFPGGLGTMDELSELLNLIQAKKIKPRIVVLIGVHYWKAYQEFYEEAYADHLLANETQSPVITDDIEYAVNLILQTAHRV